MTQQQYIDALQGLWQAYNATIDSAAHLAACIGPGEPQYNTFLDVVRSAQTLKSSYNVMRSWYMIAYPNGPYVDPL